MTIQPPTLQKNDSVILIAPARKIEYKAIQAFIALLENWGLKTLLSPTIFNTSHQFSGTDKERLKDFQWALNHPTAKAIICVRGGYGSVRIIDHLDFSIFTQKPKWIVGYSDITVFHEHFNQNLNAATLHATMPIDYHKTTPEAFESLRKALFGENYTITSSITPNCKIPPNVINLQGKIVGGNLSIIYSLLGSSSSVNTDNKILFIEDLDEYLYHIDRMMINLKRNNRLKNLKALIVGGMTDMHDNTIPFGKNAQEIILDVCQDYDFPILFDFPAGHVSDNRALIFNKTCQLTITNDLATLDF